MLKSNVDGNLRVPVWENSSNKAFLESTQKSVLCSHKRYADSNSANKKVLKGVPRQWNPHRVKTLEMLWDVKYSSPPTKRAYLFLRSEALHPSATQLLHNPQLLGADAGTYQRFYRHSLHSIHPSKTSLPLTQHLQLYLSGQRLITIKKNKNQSKDRNILNYLFNNCALVWPITSQAC